MIAEPKRWFYPAQVYAQFTSNEEKPSKFYSDDRVKQEENATKRNTPSDLADVIQVYETGSVKVDPNYAQVVITCINSKDTVDAVKTSVNKRVDYILQTLHSHDIGKNFYTVDRCLNRSESKYELSAEITVQFTNFTKCQEVSNLLVEKLDSTVVVSRPTFHYYDGQIESLRRQSCVVAVQNARAKGLEIANSLGQTLGPARFIQELSTEEFNEMEIRSNNVNGRKTFQEMLKSSALTFVTKVFAVFVLKVKKTSLKK